MKIAILGFGIEGKSTLKFLKRSPIYGGAKIEILDQKRDKNYLKNLDKFDVVFRSPGVPYNLPQIQRAIKKGIRFSSATKLFFEQLHGTTRTEHGHHGQIVIGITGTKGKGTTATLLYQILKNSGFKAALAGNIGKSALEILPKIDSRTMVILELSSFQLQDLAKSPRLAAILDIFPDHLDSHKNFKEYINAKANIGRFQNSKQDKIFYSSDNKFSKWIADQSPARKIPVSPENIGLPGLQIPGDHNQKNAAMAKAIAQNLDCPDHIIDKTIAEFKGIEHRLEFVRGIKIHSNVLKNVGMNSRIDFYNDSASTNPQTSAAAVLSFSNNQITSQSTNQLTILIAGGKDKNLNYKPLADAIKKACNVKAVMLFGENKNKIASVISNQKIVIRKGGNLESAIKIAYKTAKSLIADYRLPVTIVFSPGAASFDMFKDYKDRGRKFKKIVKQIKK